MRAGSMLAAWALRTAQSHRQRSMTELVRSTVPSSSLAHNSSGRETWETFGPQPSCAAEVKPFGGGMVG